MYIHDRKSHWTIQNLPSMFVAGWKAISQIVVPRRREWISQEPHGTLAT